MGDNCDRSTSNIVQKSTTYSVQQSVTVLGGLRLVMCTVVFSLGFFETASGTSV